MELFGTLSRAWRSKDIRKKLVFTLLMLLVFRIGSNIPVPGINRDYLAQMFSDDMGVLDLFDLFSGGSFSNFTLFAMGITPYVTASIIVQLLTVAIPYFENLSKEGAEGRKKMAAITRYLTVVLGLIQSVGMTLGLFNNAIADKNVFNTIVIIVTLTAGTAFLMWLGEQINEYGIGNGISLLIFGGIIARLPSTIRELVAQVSEGAISVVAVIVAVVVVIAVIAGIIAVQEGVRKLPVQYAKRVSGRKTYGGESTHIPLKVNQAGVIPIIFSMSIIQLPVTIAYFVPNSSFAEFVTKYISPSGDPGIWIYVGLNVVLTIAFTYFYTAITFKPEDVADQMRANGGFIPGIRPGEATQEYLSKIMYRLCLAGGVFLAVVAVTPTIVGEFTPFTMTFGGTSVLIIVGVALDMLKQIENQLLMRNYEGFLR